MLQHQLLIALQNTARTDKSKNAANENSSKPPIVIHSPWYEVFSGLAGVHWFVIPPPPPPPPL